MSNDSVLQQASMLRVRWDVFISFRGEDTRNNITQNVFDNLTEKGLRVFKDDVGMTQGDEISPSLLDAIEDSAVFVVILSPRYADSHWCLKELERICELGRLLLPVFYNVIPSDVRRQTGPFSNDFERHLSRFGDEVVGRWKSAMYKVGGISGFVFNSSKEQQLIQRIGSRVWTALKQIPVNVAAYTVGLESRVEEMTRLLDIKAKNVKVLVLHGIGGVGKTTLAKALYNKLIVHFGELRCFISISRNDGLLTLQRKLLGELFKVHSVDDVDSGVKMLKQELDEKKVLIVLDDVKDSSQLKALVGRRDWFMEGSRIIITTRNRDVLADKDLVNESHEVRELYENEALQLFSYHALRRERPTNEYVSLAKQIVSLTGRLPLALEVFGSLLFDKRRIEEWEDALGKLKRIRPKDLQDVLKLSFDVLDEEERSVFLDIACLFIQTTMKRQEVVDVLKGCGFQGEATISLFVSRSLLKIDEDHSLRMHDQIRDMGRQIVFCEDNYKPGNRSRLWDREEIMTMLRHDKGSNCVQGIVLDFKDVDHHMTREATIGTKSFKSMVNLRLLQINDAKMEGKFKYIPAEVKWLKWKGCPLENLPSDYSLDRLAVLDLSHSGIKRVWSCSSKNVAENLMVLNLRYCHNLVAIPDLSRCRKLEKLDLEHCIRLGELHKSVANVRTLLHLNVARCSNLVEFPRDVSGLRSLNILDLSGCTKLNELPKNIGSIKSLKELLLDETAISRLPESIYRLTKLEKLSLNNCKLLEELTRFLGYLTSLKELSLNGSVAKELPDSIGCLSNLEKLSLMHCARLTKIPDSIGNLVSLMTFLLNHSAIAELPDSIGSLCFLKELSVGGCKFLKKLPDTVEGLACVGELQLDGTSIMTLPDQIGSLKMIEKLEIRNVPSLTFLPDSIGNMLTLTSLNLFGANIVELPESIGMLENLVVLRLDKCSNLRKLPDSIGNLKSLIRLFMQFTAVTELPEMFGMLSSLVVLKLRKHPPTSQFEQENQVVLRDSFSTLSLLEELDARAWRISGQIPDSFEKLSSLQILNLSHNKFTHLPSSMRGLSILRKLDLSHCQQLKSLPPLPLSLEEVYAAHCVALETIYDLSNLESLELLELTNCVKLSDIPGLEDLKSLKRLYMSGCGACFNGIKGRLTKVCLRNIRNLSMPGSQIPDWFLKDTAIFSEHKNHEIRAVIIAVVICLENQIPDDLRNQIPVVPNIDARIGGHDHFKHTTRLYLRGVPKCHENQVHFCRYTARQPLVSMLEDGNKIEVRKVDVPNFEGVQLKKIGIHLVYEDDDDYDGNEESLDENQLSVSEKLARFFNSLEDDDS